MDSLKRHLLISLISVEQPIGNLCIIIQIFLFPNNIFINIYFPIIFLSISLDLKKFIIILASKS